MTLAEACTQQFRDKERQWLISMLIAAAEKHELPPALVLAVASRETAIRNIAGDVEPGHGPHGFGAMQLDDRSHQIPEDWQEHPAAILDTCCALLVKNIAWAKKTFRASEVSPERIALAAYNAGPAGAARGLARGNVDHYTANRNYSSETMQRKAIFARLLVEAGEKA